MRSLGQVVAELRGERGARGAAGRADVGQPAAAAGAARSGSTSVDLADLHGHGRRRYAVEVAAAGGHHLLLSGPKGAGKTTLAERIPGDPARPHREEALELTAIHSLAGALEPGDGLITRPPFSAPHHDASKASLVGGGTRPGPARARSAAPTAGCCSSTSSRCSAPT